MSHDSSAYIRLFLDTQNIIRDNIDYKANACHKIISMLGLDSDFDDIGATDNDLTDIFDLSLRYLDRSTPNSEKHTAWQDILRLSKVNETQS